MMSLWLVSIFPLVGISKDQNEIFLQVYLTKDFSYDEYEAKSRNDSVLEIRKIETYLDIVKFFFV